MKQKETAIQDVIRMTEGFIESMSSHELNKKNNNFENIIHGAKCILIFLNDKLEKEQRLLVEAFNDGEKNIYRSTIGDSFINGDDYFSQKYFKQ